MIPAFTSVTNNYLNPTSQKIVQKNNAQKNGAIKVNDVFSANLETVSVPRTGGAGGCLAGTAVGFVAGGLVAVCVTVAIWGTGTGLWVEGDKAMNGDLELAGRIMVLYVTLPLLGVGALIGACYGACGGIIATSND